ncbi:hypothetical protein CRUP_023260 [Coryphaenoides rupestris]|nr:hypothetical protein CRUP_023260 [Coryphaenoides rupestris]
MKGDSRDHIEAICCTTELPDHAVSEQEEDEKVEEVEEVNSEQQQVLNQTSSVAAQEPDLKRRLSCEEPGVEPVGVSREQPSERTNHPQEDEDQGAEEPCCTNDEVETSGDETPNGLNRMSESEAIDEEEVSQEEDLETSSTEPQEEVVIIISASQQDDGIQNVNGHLGKSSEEVAPSTGAEDTHTKTNAYDLILSEEDGGQQRATELSPSTGDLSDLGV